MCSVIWAATPIAWPSPTIAWSRLLTERSRFVGAIPLTTTSRNCCLYLSMSSCAASCCICFSKVSCASVTSASWPIAAHAEPRGNHRQFERCLALPQMWWVDAGHRKAYSCGASAPFSAGPGRRRRMRHRPTSRNLCALPLAISLCVFLSNQSLFFTPQGHPYRITFELSATLLLSRLGALFFHVSSGHRQTYSSSIEFA
jgi:hypothetical protein